MIIQRILFEFQKLSDYAPVSFLLLLNFCLNFSWCVKQLIFLTFLATISFFNIGTGSVLNATDIMCMVEVYVAAGVLIVSFRI